MLSTQIYPPRGEKQSSTLSSQEVPQHLSFFPQNRTLYTLSSVFPFSVFPDTIIIDETKITVIYREFFFGSQAHSIPLENITATIVETGPFLATLKITANTFIENIMAVSSLWKNQAIQAKNIIEGLCVLTKKRIDTTKYSRKTLLSNLENMCGDLSLTEIT